MNVAGQVSRLFEDVYHSTALSVDDLSKGIYCLLIQHDDELEHWKFIKE